MSDSIKNQSLFARFESAVVRYCPDPLVFAVILTLFLMALVALLTDTTAGQSIKGWGDGLHGLLAFMTQMTLVIITAHVLAHTNAVAALLKALGRVPKTPIQAYIFVVLCAAAFSLICWPLGPIAGGLVAREVAIRAKDAAHIRFARLDMRIKVRVCLIAKALHIAREPLVIAATGVFSS